MRQGAVLGRRLHIKQHLAAGLIGMALVDQRGNHLLHLGNIVRCPWLYRWLQATETAHIQMVLLRCSGRHQSNGLVKWHIGVIAGGADVYLVINIGDVAHIGDVFRTIEMAQQPEQQIKDDGRPSIADMGIIINRRTTDIHAHIVRINRLKRVLLTGQCIVQFQARIAHKTYSHCACGQGFCLETSGDENSRTSDWLANNNPADACGGCAAKRFHGATYRRL